jgi:hypothetical protein
VHVADDVGDTAQSVIYTNIYPELVVRGADAIVWGRPAALEIARALQSQLFFYEVEWGAGRLQDSVELVFKFLDDVAGAAPDSWHIPTGVVLSMTKCYSTSCTRANPCYAFSCPQKVRGTCMYARLLQLATL